jgi:hypothetical protein
MSDGYRFEVGQRVRAAHRGVVGVVASRSVETDRITGRTDRYYTVEWVGPDRRETVTMFAEPVLVSA